MRYITASEIGQFSYCKRKWGLDRKKKQSGKVEVLAPTDPREIGIRAHERHAERVESTQRETTRLDIIIMLAALALAGAVIGIVLGRML